MRVPAAGTEPLGIRTAACVDPGATKSAFMAPANSNSATRSAPGQARNQASVRLPLATYAVKTITARGSLAGSAYPAGGGVVNCDACLSDGGPRPCFSRQEMMFLISTGLVMTAMTAILPPHMGRWKGSTS